MNRKPTNQQAEFLISEEELQELQETQDYLKQQQQTKDYDEYPPLSWDAENRYRKLKLKWKYHHYIQDSFRILAAYFLIEPLQVVTFQELCNRLQMVHEEYKDIHININNIHALSYWLNEWDANMDLDPSKIDYKTIFKLEKEDNMNRIYKNNQHQAQVQAQTFETLTIHFDPSDMYFIGTNKTGGDFFKNSQFAIFADFDKDNQKYTYKHDLILAGMKDGMMTFSRHKNAMILISVYNYANLPATEPKKWFITWEVLNQLRKQEISLAQVEQTKQYIPYNKNEQKVQ